MDYLPIFCQLQHKACLLVGGGGSPNARRACCWTPAQR